MIPQTKAQWIGFAAFFICQSLMEYWFGRTKKTSAGSLFELIVSTAIGLTVAVAQKLKKKEKVP